MNVQSQMAAIAPRVRVDDVRWDAWVAGDIKIIGRLFMGVTSTGIFCRPGCPARRPKRENVVFFESTSQARAAGFRACLRCKPEEADFADRHSRAIEAACRTIEYTETPVSLSVLAGSARMSQFHFHRLFKQAMGVTPRQYRAGLQADRAKQALGENGSVTGAIYDAGFSSSGRFYEVTSPRMGMTASERRGGGADVTIRYAARKCRLGWLLIAATDRGICEVWLADDSARLKHDLKQVFPAAHLERGDQEFTAWVDAVVTQIDNRQPQVDLPLDLLGTAFEQQVWQALLKIPSGATRTYSQIAREIGRPNAVRAVAGACAKNHVAVVVPCHRVKRCDGGLGGYRWGLKRKKELLQREQ